jgi:hypothetical protein
MLCEAIVSIKNSRFHLLSPSSLAKIIKRQHDDGNGDGDKKGIFNKASSAAHKFRFVAQQPKEEDGNLAFTRQSERGAKFRLSTQAIHT